MKPVVVLNACLKRCSLVWTWFLNAKLLGSNLIWVKKQNWVKALFFKIHLLLAAHRTHSSWVLSMKLTWTNSIWCSHVETITSFSELNILGRLWCSCWSGTYVGEKTILVTWRHEHQVWWRFTFCLSCGISKLPVPSGFLAEKRITRSWCFNNHSARGI